MSLDRYLEKKYLIYIILSILYIKINKLLFNLFKEIYVKYAINNINKFEIINFFILESDIDLFIKKAIE